MNSYYSREPPRFSQLQKIPDFAKEWISLDIKRKKMIEDIRQNDLQNIRNTSLIMVIPLLITSFGGGLLIADQMLKPINKLISATQKVTSQNLGNIFQIETEDDEFGILTKNFNAMSQRLKQSFDNQKEFTANASHELRTPLAIIQAALDSALEDNNITPKEVNRLITTAQKSSKDMNDIINNLLLLATLENKIILEKCDVIKVVKKAILNIQKAYPKRTILFKPGPQTKIVKGNSTLLLRAFENVIENATKYSKSGTSVKVLCIDEDSKLIVKVIDKGIGIKKKDIKNITNRFYRAEKSRCKKISGFGLGLSITKKIVDLHSAQLSIKSKFNVGTTVQFTFSSS